MAYTCYDALSGVYDKLNRNVDYGALASFAEKEFEKFAVGRIRSVIDVGCGTGSLTAELALRGYDMTGLDASEGMLTEARATADRLGVGEMLLVLGDMRRFETPVTYDAAVCSMDGVNHLLNTSDMTDCFRSVRNALRKDGLFLFDVNTPYKIREVYGDNSFVIEEDGAMCVWQNRTDAKRRVTVFSVSVFEETEDGLWTRRDGETRERAYSANTLSRCLASASLLPLGIFGDYGFGAPEETAERWYIAARAI